MTKAITLFTAAATSAAMLALTTTASADVTWADWQNSGNAVVTGTIGGNAVTFAGQFSFATTSASTNYWNGYAAAYTSPTVPNLPDSSDIVGLTFNGGTLSFATAVTNPVMAIVSLGNPGLGSQWNFDAPFVILSQGPGAWGNGPLSNPSGNILQGSEGHGTIQFIGTYSSISWTVASGESWAGFTVGVPAPGAAALLAVGSLLGVRRRRF